MHTPPSALPFLLLLLVAIVASASAADRLPGRGKPVVQHRIAAKLDPDNRRLTVTDRIQLPVNAPASIQFQLHAGFEPKLLSDGGELVLETTAQSGAVPVENYRLTLKSNVREITLEYAGEIDHPIKALGEEYARSFSVSPGLIGDEGIFLTGNSHWLPSFAALPNLTFELTVTLPDGWRAVSQGQRTDRTEADGRVQEIWNEQQPQQEVYLIAAPFTEYRRPGSVADAVVFLRDPDEALAERYLDLTDRYLAMYQNLIGPYPYAKFALVENFWQTGYGMPSFTLLGSQVIRLPFIPYTSYPHEILHNWWGNSVYIDYANGNWAEGLTSYLADHLLKAQRGSGSDYRRDALQKYADYVGDHEDFPLVDFRGRHNAVTQAVGYGKTMMVFHMLRGQLGDEAFKAGLKRLYTDNQFQITGWDQVAAAFESVSDAPLDTFFTQWVEQSGAPLLALEEVAVNETASGYRLTASIEQRQDGPVYQLQVPVAIMLEGQEQAMTTTVPMDERRQTLELTLPARPLRLDLDPAFDLFRRLYREEIPPAISQAFGAEQVLMVLPAAAPEPLQAAYRRLAEVWQRGRSARIEIALDTALEALPNDRAVWLLGWENRFRPMLAEALAGYDVRVQDDGLRLAGQALTPADHSAVVLARHPGNPEQALGWLVSARPAALPGLARKLPHYGKYSYLGFTGDAPENRLKGQWPPQGSPLSVALAGDQVPPLVLAPRPPLAVLPPAFSADRMQDDISTLAAPSLQGRGLGSDGLETAAAHIAEQFQAAGLMPAGDTGDTWFQVWQTRSGEPEQLMTLRNIIGKLPGSDPALADRPLVIGAHYDHLGLGWPKARAKQAGRIHPGADDNASGVAVMLELARVLAAGGPPPRPILFIAFTGEEAGRLGSQHYVETLGENAGKVFGMLNLDSVGRLESRSLMVLGGNSAAEWAHILRGAGYMAGVQVQIVREPLDASDQTSFIAAGIPAVQLFSGTHGDYHRPTDTPDKINADGLVKVATVAKAAIDYLTGSDARLTA
ncbi:MAG TPA: peptidase M28, partial [Chromatiaceae bacterium]|nr:peptidase M28 [Chromatiaceae bacterium]